MLESIGLHNEVDYFYELPHERLRRFAFGMAHALRPAHLSIIPTVLTLTLEHLLKSKEERQRFPAARNPVGEAGLIGLCDDLSVPTLVKAYSDGLFPFCHFGPVKWWSPLERSVVFENRLTEDRVEELLRERAYHVSFDHAFADVIEACAKHRADRNLRAWITPRMMDAYLGMYHAGFAHSIEVWDSKDRLVGGIYGVAIGSVFFKESQFSKRSNTDELASAVLDRHLRAWKFGLRTGRCTTEHDEKAGCVRIPRKSFNALVRKHVAKPSRTELWEIEEDLISS